MGKFVTIGIAGHVDHGKTSLVRCLTGIDTDRMKAEKLRQFSIESGVAPLMMDPELSIALVDVLGHADFFKNTVRVHLLRAILDELCFNEKLVKVTRGVQIPDHKTQLSKEEDRLARCLLDFAESADGVPFTAGKFFDENEAAWKIDKIQRMLRILHRQKKLICLPPMYFIGCNAMDQIKQQIKTHILIHGSFKIADRHALMGVGRDVVISILEYLDGIGFTRREGDARF